MSQPGFRFLGGGRGPPGAKIAQTENHANGILVGLVTYRGPKTEVGGGYWRVAQSEVNRISPASAQVMALKSDCIPEAKMVVYRDMFDSSQSISPRTRDEYDGSKWSLADNELPSQTTTTSVPAAAPRYCQQG